MIEKFECWLCNQIYEIKNSTRDDIDLPRPANWSHSSMTNVILLYDKDEKGNTIVRQLCEDCYVNNRAH